MSDLPWRAKQFAGGYSAEYLPEGGSVWIIVKHPDGGRRRVTVFNSIREALEGAQRAYLDRMRGSITASIEIPQDVKDARLAEKLKAEAESFLRSSREDKQKATTIRRAGRKEIIVMRGRA